MQEDTNLIDIAQPKFAIEEIARLGAQQMLAAALEAEVAAYLNQHSHSLTSNGLRAVVRNGYHQERDIATAMGPLRVRVPRTRDRNGETEAFASSLIPKYMRKSLALEEALPYFYLGGLSNGDFIPCFEKLFGQEVRGVSSASITRLKQVWSDEMRAWKQRDLSDRRYCYLWVDGIHFNTRNEERLCVLVAIGATAEGKKELVAVEGGYRESEPSWRSLLDNLKQRGLEDPLLCIGDGALGFWKALRDVFPESKEQRCWVHKTANILDKMPKSVQPQAKELIHCIYQAEKKQKAEEAYAEFIERYEDRYPKAVKCLEKDADVLFSFYSFPAAHWQHIRSTNVIESTFATVRLTKKTRGHGSMTTTLAMAFKLVERAEQRWRKIKKYQLVEKLFKGVEFKDGEEVKLAA